MNKNNNTDNIISVLITRLQTNDELIKILEKIRDAERVSLDELMHALGYYIVSRDQDRSASLDGWIDYEEDEYILSYVSGTGTEITLHLKLDQMPIAIHPSKLFIIDYYAEVWGRQPDNSPFTSDDHPYIDYRTAGDNFGIPHIYGRGYVGKEVSVVDYDNC